MGAALALLMTAIAFIDARSFTIPDELTGIGFTLGSCHEVLLSDGQFVNAFVLAVARGVFLAAAFWALRIGYRWFRGRDGLGLGDVKLAAVAGAWLNTSTMPVAIEMAALSGIAVYVVRQRILNRPLRATGRLPFGAFFAPAIWLAWLFGIVMAGKI